MGASHSDQFSWSPVFPLSAAQTNVGILPVPSIHPADEAHVCALPRCRSRSTSAPPLFKHVLGHWHRREHVWPSRIEDKMRQGFRYLGLGEAVVEPDRDVAGELSDLSRSDQ